MLIKVCWIQCGFEVERNLLLTKNKYFSLPDHQLPEAFLFLVCKKGEKEDKKQICNFICRNYSYNYFHVKMSLKLLVQPLLQSVFSVIT